MTQTYRVIAVLLILVVGALVWMPNRARYATKRQNQVSKARVVETFGKLPLRFEVNKGQADKTVKFLSRGKGYSLLLTSNEATLTLHSPQRTQRAQGCSRIGTDDTDSLSGKADEIRVIREVRERYSSAPSTVHVRMKLVGANSQPQMRGWDKLPGKVNYFIGNDPKQWLLDVPTYARVRYEDVYPGVDLVYYGNQQQLEYDFIIAPGVDPQMIALEFEGADKIKLDANGDLLLRTAYGEIRQRKPHIYQHINGTRHEIPGGYAIRNTQYASRFTFHVGAYDSTKPLIIDPVLVYSTYLGSNSADYGGGIAVDAAGSAYVAGFTYSTDFPTVNPFQPNKVDNYDVFVAKLNAAGDGLDYCTYLGGSGYEDAYIAAVDSYGNAYVAGRTQSLDFPTENPAQPTYGGGDFDAFVAKLHPNGNALIYSTYIGGSGEEIGGVAVDASHNATVAGLTASADFPTMNALQPTFGGIRDAFVTKFSPTGATVYSTYLGGDGDDNGGVAADAAGNAYVAGWTTSTNFPTVNPLQSTKRGYLDVFVAKLNPTGSALVYSTYLGGSGNDITYGSITVDGSGNVAVTGETDSTDFPTVNPAQPYLGGFTDGFVAKLNSTGSALVYSTYLGGSSNDYPRGIAVDASANVYVSGTTQSTDFPTENPLQSTHGGGTSDAFVSKLSSTGSVLLYSTYLGGNGADNAERLTVDAVGNAYVTGHTESTNFPTADALQPSPSNFGDAFVVKIGDAPDLTGYWVTLKQSCKRTGAKRKCTIKGTFYVQNTGTQKAGAASRVRFFLSSDSTLDGGDTFLKQVLVDALKPGQTKKSTLSHKLPTGSTASGKFVLAAIDADNVVTEISETNNVMVSGPLN